MNLQKKSGINPMLVFLATILHPLRAMEGNLMAMVGAFIAVAILLGVGTIILGNSTMDCSGLDGFSSTAGASTGWAETCEDANDQAQSAYVLLLIVLIVIAAVVILTVVRML